MDTNDTLFRLKSQKGGDTPFSSARRFFTKRVLSLFLVFFYILFSTGCTGSKDNHNAMTEHILPTVPGEIAATLPGPLLPDDSSLILRVAAHSENNMNPLTPKHSDTRAIFALVYEPLMRMNAEGRMELVLAESADFNASCDMLRIKIRDQAVFQDNNPVRAEDVRACLLEVIRQVTGGVPGAIESPATFFSAEALHPSESENEPIETSFQEAGETGQEKDGTNNSEQEPDDADKTKTGTDEGKEDVTEETDGIPDTTDPFARTPILLRDIVSATTFMDDLDSQRTLILPQEGGFDPAEYSTLYQYRTRALDNIASVSIEEGILYIGFHVPDRDFAQYLTFPVIPASFVRNTLSLAIPGSGEWKITPGGFRGHYSLYRVSVGEGISRIDVFPYDRVSDAVRAFDEGSIDLLFMDETTAPLYASRSRIRKQRFEAPGYTALYFSGQKESAIEARDRFRLALSEHPVTMNELATPHESATFPISRGDWRLFGAIETHAGREPGASWTALEKTDTSLPFVLLVPEGYVPARFLNRLEPLFLLQDVKLEIKIVAAEDWFEMLREGDYDGAILTDVALGVIDPVDWLDSLDEAGLWSWREHASASAIATLESLSSCPVISEGTSPAVRDARYTAALKGVFDTVPVIGIGGLDTMVWYGSDVRGTMTGTWNAPLEEVERLTLWRP